MHIMSPTLHCGLFISLKDQPQASMRMATRILIEILKEFHKNSVVIYFLKNSDQILKEFVKTSVVI